MDYGQQMAMPQRDHERAYAEALSQKQYAAKGTAAPQGDSQPTIMSASHMEMDEITNHIARNTMMLRDLRDRLFGSQPEKPNNTTPPRPVANGSVQLLGEKVEAAKMLLREQTALVVELQRVG